VLLFYRTETAGWSLVIVLLGLPVYWLWSRQNKTAAWAGDTKERQSFCRRRTGPPLQCV